jgi:hypothetical protein
MHPLRLHQKKVHVADEVVIGEEMLVDDHDVALAQNVFVQNLIRRLSVLDE